MLQKLNVILEYPLLQGLALNVLLPVLLFDLHFTLFCPTLLLCLLPSQAVANTQRNLVTYERSPRVSHPCMSAFS